MAEDRKMRRYSAGEIKRNLYLQLHQFLIYDPFYREMSDSARVAYAILYNRFKLSKRNNRVDGDGNVYLIFTRAELQEVMNKSEKTIIRIMSELRSYGLIEEKRRGQGKPNLIYMLFPENPDFTTPDEDSRTVNDDDLELESGVFETLPECGDRPVNESVASYRKKELSNIDSRERERERATPPEPPSLALEEKQIYGDLFKQVRMYPSEYENLKNLHGDEIANDFINQYDARIAQNKVPKSNNHAAVVSNWILRAKEERRAKDDASAANGQAEYVKPKPNRFINFNQRSKDYAEIERLEKAYLAQKYGTAENEGDKP